MKQTADGVNVYTAPGRQLGPCFTTSSRCYTSSHLSQFYVFVLEKQVGNIPDGIKCIKEVIMEAIAESNTYIAHCSRHCAHFIYSMK